MKSGDKQEGYLPHLDGLRGGSALWVVIGHCMIWSGWWSERHDVLSPKIAVDLFIVLSGYIMTHHWRGTSDWRDEARRFWVRRFFRIAPAYHLSLAAAALLAPWFLSSYAVLYQRQPHFGAVYDPSRIAFTPLNLLAHVTFVFGLFPWWSYSTMLPDWSIGLEMQFYAAFPFLIARIRKKLTLPLLLSLVLGSATVMAWAAQLPPARPGYPPGYPEPSLLPLKLPLFLAGILAAEAVREKQMGIAVAAVALSAFFGTALVPLTVAGLIYLGSTTPETAGGLRRVLGCRAARFLADTSYCAYLFHGFFIAFIGGALFRQGWYAGLSSRWHFLILALLVVPAVYLTAFLLHHGVEQPGIRWGREILRRRTAPEALSSGGG